MCQAMFFDMEIDKLRNVLFVALVVGLPYWKQSLYAIVQKITRNTIKYWLYIFNHRDCDHV